MLDVGWTEMLVIAIVMIVVVGPKDLPKMLRTFGKTTAKMRSMAGDFRKQFDDALKEAELDGVKDSLNDLRKMNPAADIKKALNPMEKAAAEVRAGLEAALKPTPPPTPSPVTHAAEPLKSGPVATSGEAAPVVTAPPPPVAAAAPAPAVATAPAAAPAPKAVKAPKAPAKPTASAPAAKKPAAAAKKTGTQK
jgi:sec-independent protein translocase protein TatB